jgi:D-cysteine desulfhydrase
MVEPERISLANLPTPLVRLDRLSHELDAEIWLKRDDMTGLELSGNKVRKLEYVAADAIAEGCDTLVTEGTPQSNHCRATAAVCARLGLRAVLLLRPLPPEQTQGNHLLDVLFGAETRAFDRVQFEEQRSAIIEQTLAELRAVGRRPRWTPMGASEPLGCWGYIRALRELSEQLDERGIGSCDLVLAASSGGTCAGATLGKLLHHLDNINLCAVPVSDDIAFHEAQTAELCQATIERYDLPIEFDPAAIQFIPGYVGDGYAVPYAAAIEVLRLLARTEAVVLDPVYTAKAFTALTDAVRSRRLGVDRPAVFAHTGGVFSNFAWPELVVAG